MDNNSITLTFNYVEELKLFLQLFFLGMILSAIVMYITEAIKKWMAPIEKIKERTWIISIVCFLISIGFGTGWAATFAPESIVWPSNIWLGFLLYLGSTGLYSKLENSGGFWGKTVKSYSEYINSDKLVKAVTEAADKKESDKSAGE